MIILVIGDIVGQPGRIAVQKLLPRLRQQYQPAMIIANGENVAGGIGLTPGTAGELLDIGVDVITSGNHIWAHRELLPYLDGGMPILRPLNYPPGVPGRGYLVRNQVMVVNLMGRTFIGDLDCPFRGMDKLLAEVQPKPPIIIVDFHAEATSEKVGMGHYLDGRVSAVLGTHTHVATADGQIFPRGMAYITDIGMTGPKDSIIGDDIENVLHRFLTRLPHHMTVAKSKISIFNGVVLDIDEATGRANKIERVYGEVET